ncbi:hypothetical protein BD408DRAFT_424255 [Parasitella parasitica]|nr:hypothetical protein BD408DRAFT_424255 [Parasitella parasitica]
MALMRTSNTQPDTYLETPPRTTSLQFWQIIKNSSPSSLPLCSIFENEFKGADFDTCSASHTCYSSCSDSSNSSSLYCSSTDNNDITLERLSHVVAAAIKSSMSNSKCIYSFFSGNASIIYDKISSKKRNDQFSTSLSNWARSATARPKLPNSVYDDGKDELIYHGISVNEIKTTLNPMVVSTKFNSNIPEIRLQRPHFARINY